MNANFASRERRIRVDAAEDFGRVAVVYGGFSSEREISLKTGAAVLEALRSREVDALAWDPADRPIGELTAAGVDRVWIALHGPGGEDGALQGALEWSGLPYSGSGVLSSALAMDKVRSKQLFAAIDIPTPTWHVAYSSADALIAADLVGYPLIVKPSAQGSSVGMSKVLAAAELEAAVRDAMQYDSEILIEQYLPGEEFTVGILQGEALASIRIETPRTFYDYRAKYESKRTEYHCPGADGELEASCADLALKAFAGLGCHGWGRVDFICDAAGEPQAIEVNTVPGMTSHSLVPMAAAERGIDFAELCWRILETSMTERAHGA